jgi:hypothetical protein
MVFTRVKLALTAIVVLGGIAVLASYVYGLVTHPHIGWSIWGGVPMSLRPLYTVSMIAAASGFFFFTSFIVLRIDPPRFRMTPRLGYGVFLVLYVFVLSGSVAWMPLTYRMLEEPSMPAWIAICGALAVVACGPIGLLCGLLRVEQRHPVRWYRLAVVGCLLFCWQTVVLDAVVWTYYFPV